MITLVAGLSLLFSPLSSRWILAHLCLALQRSPAHCCNSAVARPLAVTATHPHHSVSLCHSHRAMSASTAALSGTNFRRIDIDQYDEDRVDPASLYHPDPRGPARALAASQDKDRAVRGLLQRGDVGGALKEVLREGEWPYGEDSEPETKQAKVRLQRSVQGGRGHRLAQGVLGDEHIKSVEQTGALSPPADLFRWAPQATALATVLSILNSTRSTDIPALVQQLDPSEQVRSAHITSCRPRLSACSRVAAGVPECRLNSRPSHRSRS